ncbi:hypothetical protein HMPREF0201_00532 [Cedecea davisae DSM 4568]|uniref:Uncharacterized protein n=1 Tax=Cedecea davisae DSM 4568 TaxID=566551 RepID=S3JKT8_9ENTR|nr:hypothetical protein HMPREF0201_00532 [Cedecea davisae DSM 4568]
MSLFTVSHSEENTTKEFFTNIYESITVKLINFRLWSFFDSTLYEYYKNHVLFSRWQKRY